jgi:hypothetical protein
MESIVGVLLGPGEVVVVVVVALIVFVFLTRRKG